MADKVFMFSEQLQLTLPGAYGLVRAKSGLAHIIKQDGLQTLCTGKVLAGPYYIVPTGPEVVANKCQKCLMKTHSHWLHYTGGYAGSRVNANRGDGDK
jgi:hypothetical protein